MPLRVEGGFKLADETPVPGEKHGREVNAGRVVLADHARVYEIERGGLEDAPLRGREVVVEIRSAEARRDRRRPGTLVDNRRRQGLRDLRGDVVRRRPGGQAEEDRKSTRLNSSH